MEILIYIALPALVIGALSLIFGGVLAYAGSVFYVDEDPRVAEITAALPGASCGACGEPGCGAFAEAVASGLAAPTGCPIGGSKTAALIAEIMGVRQGEFRRKTAFVRCAGAESLTSWRYSYFGLSDCAAMGDMPGGGPKTCLYGCLGCGSCKTACKFNAVNVSGGLAVIDMKSCASCGLCVAACPRGLIELVPDDKLIRVACYSPEDGSAVKAACRVGCIGCGICVKSCRYDAIHMSEDHLASVDYDKCAHCGACASRCPTKSIVNAAGG